MSPPLWPAAVIFLLVMLPMLLILNPVGGDLSGPVLLNFLGAAALTVCFVIGMCYVKSYR